MKRVALMLVLVVTMLTPGSPASAQADSSPAEIRNRSQSIVHEGKIVFHMASPAQ